ncbi:5-aminolevulinate synthase [Periconia macrospinosa]|uniref:5-aminolevulinate synthase n=1 Tax=Periconia macrospinosa TaxID=97972 RepID=A0A2V1DP23_9PLEO|nr:5-aminolevulinate synthase [Periconia macrospinosa]
MATNCPSETTAILPTDTQSIESTILAPAGFLATRLKNWQPRSQPTKPLPAFYRNIEESLNQRRNSRSICTIVQNYWQTSNAVDFCSGDILSLNAGGALRAAFLDELSQFPDFTVGSGGVRLMDGNYTYLERVEHDIAAFHGAEDGIIVGSAYEANVAVWTALPRPGDVIVYDKLVHASTHEGMRRSRALQRISFEHNNIDHFRDTLVKIIETNAAINAGNSSILVAVESIYSMDGDVCPLKQFMEVAKDVTEGKGNVQFIVDEAHGVGVLGPNGSGLVCQLKLEKEVAVVVHSFGKAVGAAGAIILGSPSIKSALVNFGRSILFTTSPSFPFVAAIKAGYNLLGTVQGQTARDHIQMKARLFFNTLTSHNLWETCHAKGILHVPLAQGWEDRAFLTHIITVSTREKYILWLFVHLMAASFSVFSVPYPIVPLGQDRVRIIIHAGNTDEQIVGLVNALFTWAEEIIEIEQGTSSAEVSSVASKVNEWMRKEGLTARL